MLWICFDEIINYVVLLYLIRSAGDSTSWKLLPIWDLTYNTGTASDPTSGLIQSLNITSYLTSNMTFILVFPTSIISFSDKNKGVKSFIIYGLLFLSCSNLILALKGCLDSLRLSFRHAIPKCSNNNKLWPLWLVLLQNCYHEVGSGGLLFPAGRKDFDKITHIHNLHSRRSTNNIK